MLGLINNIVDVVVDFFSFAADFIAVIPALLVVYAFAYYMLLPKDISGNLFDTLKNGKYITSQAELNYQIKCYVKPTFLHDGKKHTTKELIKTFKKPSGVFVITGKPASGKTTAMRYLYYRLSKTRKCIYVQMKAIRNIDDLTKCINLQLEKQSGFIWKKNKKIIAFFDGIDEALAFRLDTCTSAIESIESLFFKKSPEIYNLFSSCALELDSIVISLRPEFLESLNKLRKSSVGNRILQVYQIEPPSDEDVIKIFKSLKVLQRMDKSSLKQRHASRYPSRRDERKYIELLKKILKDNDDCIFYYPMFVRYAYPFMQMYEEYGGNKYLPSASNMARSFKTVLEAALKWEFHVYYGTHESDPAKRDQAFGEFKNAINDCMDQVVRLMLEKDPDNKGNSKAISRQELECILSNYAYGDKDQLVIAHCIMTTDDDGKMFDFFHNTFYEYYLAKYLLLRADYQKRKERLLYPDPSRSLLQMYYLVLCDDEELCVKMFNSILHLDDEQCDDNERRKKLKFVDCVNFEINQEIHVRDNPEMYVVDILRYCPFITKFIYRKNWFSRMQVENMMDGTMNLSPTDWEILNCAEWLAPAQDIKTLNLWQMSLYDVHALRNYINLEYLDIRLNTIQEQIVYDALEILRNIPLKCIYVYTEDGHICEHIQELMNQGAFSVEDICVDVMPYSKAYVSIYKLKQKVSNSGGLFRFRVSHTDPDLAHDEYNKASSLKNLQILTAVFELESDYSTSYVKQDISSETAAVIWNGLSLAKFYKDQDEYESLDQIYQRLEPHVLAHENFDEVHMNQSSADLNYLDPEIELKFQEVGSEASIYFSIAYGNRLTLVGKYPYAKQWLIYAYKYGASLLSEDELIHIGVYIYKDYVYWGECNCCVPCPRRNKCESYRSCAHSDNCEYPNACTVRDGIVHCYGPNFKQFEDELWSRVECASSYKVTSDHLFFWDLYCNELFRCWVKGYDPPDELDYVSQMLLEKSRTYAKENNDTDKLFFAVYIRLVFENRMEHTKEAGELLKELASHVPMFDDTADDRHMQDHWIMYKQQQLYYLLLTDQKGEVIKTANELLAYPHRTTDVCKDEYQQVIDWYTQGTEEGLPIDRHIFWSDLWS